MCISYFVMADELTENLLRQWGFSHKIEDFKDQSIDYATLQILTEAELTQLLPVLGERARFRQLWAPER
ncbi:hypothetical protein PPYR_01569 [Photinus pyralis]|uniref:SAM domain-containing protein n=1 Tax=Photinus pyralis TaxID=7054 RepID=A0A5N4B4Q0_PHOPY|nr:hypothetical protein PPYR_01569 [Photinus pyralis]